MQNSSQHRLLAFFLATLVVVALGGCASPEASGDALNQTITTAQVTPAMNELPTLTGKATVQMTVNGEPITIEVDGEKAPITAGNFVDLVDQGFYDGLAFHRVVKQPQPFVAQGGDPLGNGTGGYVDPDTNQPRNIPLEITPTGTEEPVYGKTFKQAGISAAPALQHRRGAVAMARSQMPNSASSQFYFALADLAFLDGDYAVFGYVTDGMDAVDSISQGDTIESAQVVSGIENLQR
jgi:peptidyl-prolyl cis-trans isomerase B (cyclophilin B)